MFITDDKEERMYANSLIIHLQGLFS